MTYFNISELSAVIWNRWKFILLFTIGSVIMTAVAIVFIPPKYTAITKVLPGNAVLADKARLFNADLQHLYSFFGSGDDLDRLMSMTSMDTSLKQVIRQFHLIDYYQVKEQDPNLGMYKTIRHFKKDLHLVKTVNNEMELSCTHTNKDTAAAIVNFMAEQTATKMQTIWKEQYAKISTSLDSSLANLTNQYNALAASSNNTDAVAKAKMGVLLTQIEQFNKLSIETKIAANTTPAAMIVLEKATPPAKISWPDKTVVLPLSALLGCLFSILLVLVSAKPNRY